MNLGTAETRRKLHLIVFLLWIGPGAILSIVFAKSLPWIVFMSWYAIIATHIAGFSAETPVEEENG